MEPFSAAKRGLELIDAGLDELRVSLDAAEPNAFALVRGRDMFAQILRNLRRFSALQRERQADSTEGLALAYGAEGDDRAAAGLRPPRP